MLKMFTARVKVILSLIIIIVVLVVCAACYYAWQKHADTEAKLQQAIVLTEQQARDKNVLQNKLDLSNQNAEMLAAVVKQAQLGQIQPVVNFTVQAPTIETAAQDIEKRINEKDSTLPPDALEPADRTLAVPQPIKQPDGTIGWQVGVYKVNNYRNWEWSAGYGQHGGDRYVPIELQRNFSKNAAVSYEHHFGGNEKGWEVKYTRKTDKLFFLF